MQCKKCEIEIPAQFEFVLSKNVCPKCGNKLMADAAMKVYMDLKKRLNEVEFVMDKTLVCERVAMFVVTNYEVIPLHTSSKPGTPVGRTTEAVETFKAQLATIEADEDLSPDEIRAQEAARAEELATAREMGMDVDDLEDGEEMISGKVDADRIQRLKKLAVSNKSGVMVRRSDS